jgi:hypothetical protein
MTLLRIKQQGIKLSSKTTQQIVAYRESIKNRK